MKIKPFTGKFGDMIMRQPTQIQRIVWHHSATDTGDAATFHQYHLSKGWSGIGYHYVILKDGSVEAGRPLTAVGAHAYGYNKDSIGICLVGNFDEIVPSFNQLRAAASLSHYLEDQLGRTLKWSLHRDLCDTSCPGRYFRLDMIPQSFSSTAELCSVDLPVLGKGDSGRSVEMLQRILLIEDDGIFGVNTEKAVMEFQDAVNIAVDGIVGSVTWKELLT